RYRASVDEVFDALLRGSRFDIAYDRDVVRELIDLAPPGLDELFGVLSLVDAVLGRGRQAYDVVVLDTAPTGHALRLLAMPDAAAGAPPPARGERSPPSPPAFAPPPDGGTLWSRLRSRRRRPAGSRASRGGSGGGGGTSARRAATSDRQERDGDVSVLPGETGSRTRARARAPRSARDGSSARAGRRRWPLARRGRRAAVALR